MTNVIDILLVAFVIYQFLMLVRGTRAAPMLVGVAAVAAALLVGAYLVISALSFLMLFSH